jgi:hypothetical protein
MPAAITMPNHCRIGATKSAPRKSPLGSQMYEIVSVHRVKKPEIEHAVKYAIPTRSARRR